MKDYCYRLSILAIDIFIIKYVFKTIIFKAIFL
jgi:hypothetical protein